MGKVTVWHTPCYWSVQRESHIQTSYTYGVYQSSRGGPSQIHLWKVVLQSLHMQILCLQMIALNTLCKLHSKHEL